MIRIFCDFDGTITDLDTIVFLTEKFGAGPGFRKEVVDAIKGGSISVFEGIRRELATVKATWEEARSALEAGVRVDPSFPPFVSWCAERDLPLALLSSGMLPVVRLFTGRFGLPTYAHPVGISASGWDYQRDPRNDKERVLSDVPPGDFIVFIGDGTSDVGVVPFADLLFAREGRYLAKYCRREGVAFTPFDSFHTVRSSLETVLEKQALFLSEFARNSGSL